MPRGCSVCIHAKLEEINTQILKGEGPLSLAKRYDLNAAPIRRHKKCHLAKGIISSQSEAQGMATSLLDKIKHLEIDAKRLGDLAEESGDIKTALTALKLMTNILELVAKLTGELQTVGNTINIQMGPLPSIQEVTARLSRLDTPAAAARRKWIQEGGPLPVGLLDASNTEQAIDVEFKPATDNLWHSP